MFEKFLEIVESKGLFGVSDRLLVATSGGIDSMTLCHLLNRGRFKFSVAHCNFKLRGTDSDLDEALVMNWCADNGIKFYSKSFETKIYAMNKHLSVQMAARELRYEWFNKVLTSDNFNYLLTAHHLDDSFETVIFNFTKGTGLRGVMGVPEKVNKIVRPLSSFTRHEILEYARQSDFKWREDDSNTDPKYHRNRIRNRVVPELKKINPSLLDTFRRTQARLLAGQDYLDHVLNEKFKRLTHFKGSDFFITTKSVTSIVELEHLLKPYGFNYSQMMAILDACLQGESGKLFFSSAYKLNVDRDQIIISPIPDQFSTIEIESGNAEVGNEHIALRLTVLPASAGIKALTDQASLDMDKLIFPLTLRKWREGDFFYPLGMRGKKKISDYMIDSKIPLNLKGRVGVLESAGNIVWLVGHRIDGRFKVTDRTKTICRIDLI
ncbi:MAG: tRNA lysidine(34) synthetase TilS [Bacteroidota bacterium]